MSVARKIPSAARPDADPHAGYPAPGPATRLLAKAADFFCYPFLVGCVLAILQLLTRNPEFNALAKSPAFPFAMWFGFPFIDALVHHSFGTTPGKWLLGFATIAKGDASFFNFLSRSSRAFLFGAGAITPLALITLFLSLTFYQKHGETRWDRSQGFRTYAYRNPWVGGLFVLGTLFLLAWSVAAQMAQG